ncbi:MAG: RNA polymerase sigma factor [Myxococcota bacterium]
MTALAHSRALLRLDPLADSALVELAQAGHADAFGLLVQRHHDKALSLAIGMMRNEAEARDCLQDALLNAWRKIDTFRGDARFSSWLYRITHNACLMRMRRRRRRPEVSLEVVPGQEDGFERQIVDVQPVSDELLEIDELGAHIDAAVQALPPKYREVFDLADLQHRSMKDIADHLSLSVPNVKTRLHRARIRLRGHLTPYLNAEPVAAS